MPGWGTAMALLVLVGGQGRAGAYEVAVAVCGVDAAHRRPVLLGGVDRAGEGRGLAGVRARPVVEHHVGGRMRGVPQRALLDRPLPSLDRVDLLTDGDHRVAEAV